MGRFDPDLCPAPVPPLARIPLDKSVRRLVTVPTEDTEEVLREKYPNSSGLRILDEHRKEEYRRGDQ